MTWEYFVRVGEPLLRGAGTALSLFLIVLVLSVPLGFLVTLMENSRIRIVRYIAMAYTYIMRGTPLLLQLLFIYFGLPLIPGIGAFLKLDAFTAAILGFTLNYTAYFAEIYRGGLLSIDRGQYEAAKVLGLSRVRTTFHIILPQMFKVVLPSMTNEITTLLKDTPLAFVISIQEIMYFTKTAANRDLSILPYVFAFVLYLILNTLLIMLLRKLEKKLKFE
ncbi:amino acid ABC transporter permease [Candidatus Soleaferrea massiliensis]|uniref:amino acid ABC transporter permease n=1 Tax=Candidatus Soleaferrea massiliensis TaxID=1470354 RepID=UPI00058D622D|nr:amino acid ABC transporter permease [Candidatus Soleaferrea massiliensis]